MRVWIVIVLLGLCGSLLTHIDPMFGYDKVQHFVVGFVISGITSLFMTPLIGLYVSTGLGGLKEVIDFFDPAHTASFNDFLATAIGAFAGSYLHNLVLLFKRTRTV